MNETEKTKIPEIDELSGRMGRDEMRRAIEEMERLGPELEVIECDASGTVRAYRLIPRK